MTEIANINISLAILLLPLLGFIIVLFGGKRFPKIYLVEVGIVTFAFILTLVLGFSKLSTFLHQDLNFAFTWIDFGNVPTIGNLTIDLGIKIDNLTVIMLFVVNLISLLVHIFSMAYMKGDKRYTRYFAYLGIFTFSMLGIVLTDNLLMMYIFWELVGLSSYLLIGFGMRNNQHLMLGKKLSLQIGLVILGCF